MVDHLLLPGWTPWDASPRGEDGSVGDVPREASRVDISLSTQLDNGGSEIANDDGLGGCSQTTGGLFMCNGRFRAKSTERNLLDGNDVFHRHRGYTTHTPVVGLQFQNEPAIVCLTRYRM